jgi:hypothetical protein
MFFIVCVVLFQEAPNIVIFIMRKIQPDFINYNLSRFSGSSNYRNLFRFIELSQLVPTLVGIIYNNATLCH